MAGRYTVRPATPVVLPPCASRIQPATGAPYLQEQLNHLIDAPGVNAHHDIANRPRSDDHRKSDPHLCVVNVCDDSRHSSEEAAVAKAIDEHEDNEDSQRIGLWPNHEHADAAQDDGNSQAIERAKDITKVTQPNTTNSRSDVEQGKKD